MTIKIESQVPLRVLQRDPQGSEDAFPIEDEFQQRGYVKPLTTCSAVFRVGKVPSSTADDEVSLGTASTLSFTDSESSDDDSECERRVTFSDDIVSDVWTRPYTPKDLCSKLYYSSDDTARFRQEYRMERKLLSDLSIDPDTIPVDKDLSLLVATTGGVRHRISRVVVLHNDKLETFFNPEKDVTFNDCSFDNDSFWSGSITWF
jgi:hypothetical protein